MSTVPLDANQQRAVAHVDGPCLVVAGPGSGKTRVIVERFLALLERGVAPDEVLELTYTNKAAAEMRLRAETARGSFAVKPTAWNCRRCDYRTVCDEGTDVAGS